MEIGPYFITILFVHVLLRAIRRKKANILATLNFEKFHIGNNKDELLGNTKFILPMIQFKTCTAKPYFYAQLMTRARKS